MNSLSVLMSMFQHGETGSKLDVEAALPDRERELRVGIGTTTRAFFCSSRGAAPG
jgi:hypothetical protein